MNVRLTSLLALVFAVPSLFAQQSPKTGTITFFPAKPIYPTQPNPPMTPTPLVMPLFLDGNRFTSSLTLVNNSTANTYADVTIRAQDGSTILTQRVKFSPHSQRQLQIGDMLARKGSLANTGSILIMQSSALAGPSIAGVLSMTYSGEPDLNYIDEEPTAFGITGSSVLQGVSDRADGSPVVSIASVAETAQHITVDCLGEHGIVASKKVELAAGETLVTDARARDSFHGSDFESVLERIDETAREPVGIRLTSDAKPASFAAFAVTPHRKHGGRFFSNVLFSDPKALNSPNTVFTGVPVGSAKMLPDGKYTPQIGMANFSSKEAHIHVTFAQTSGGKPQSHDVGSISIPPMSSRDLILKDLAGDPDLQNSFILTSDGAPGAVMAKLVSTSDTALHEVELQAKDQSDMANAGNHPWSIEGNTESTLLLFNHSTTPQNFDVSIFAGQVTWQKTWKLAPLETTAISLRDLIQNEIKDNSGNVLPKSVTSGELNWMDVNPTYGSGRLLQSDRATAMARNFSCGYSGLLCGADYDEYQETFTDGDVIDFAELQPLTCTSGTQNACSGQRTGTGGSFSYSWISETTSVASIANDTGANQTVNLLGVSPGTSTINGHVTSQYCSAGGGGGANVTPTLSLSQPLWYFGSGLTPPASFNQGGVSSVVTANSASGGSFAWSITNGASNISFGAGTQLSSTTTGSNTVTIYSTGYSTATNDTTVHLSWTPSGGNPIPASLTLTVDSPYKLVSAGATINNAVSGNCSNPQSGNTGYQSLVPYLIQSFTGVYISNIGVNEILGSATQDYAGNNWPLASAMSVVNPGQFYDGICSIVPTATPPSSAPQSPLSSQTIYHRPQTWSVGSTSSGQGIPVQSDILQYFVDHGLDVEITTPVR